MLASQSWFSTAELTDRFILAMSKRLFEQGLVLNSPTRILRQPRDVYIIFRFDGDKSELRACTTRAAGKVKASSQYEKIRPWLLRGGHSQDSWSAKSNGAFRIVDTGSPRLHRITYSRTKHTSPRRNSNGATAAYTRF